MTTKGVENPRHSEKAENQAFSVDFRLIQNLLLINIQTPDRSPE